MSRALNSTSMAASRRSESFQTLRQIIRSALEASFLQVVALKHICSGGPQAEQLANSRRNIDICRQAGYYEATDDAQSGSLRLLSQMSG